MRQVRAELASGVTKLKGPRSSSEPPAHPHTLNPGLAAPELLPKAVMSHQWERLLAKPAQSFGHLGHSFAAASAGAQPRRHPRVAQSATNEPGHLCHLGVKCSLQRTKLVLVHPPNLTAARKTQNSICSDSCTQNPRAAFEGPAVLFRSAVASASSRFECSSSSLDTHPNAIES